jgi:hypothetical protein
MPFLAEKITGMLYQMLRVCSPAELLEDDEKKKIDATKIIKEDVEI